MGSVLLSRSANERNISADESIGIITELIAEGGRVRLRLDAAAGKPDCEGVLVRATQEHLTFELATSDARRCGLRASVLLRVVFEVRRARWALTSLCSSAEFDVESTVIRIARPQRIAKAERRRSPRRGLHEPVRVLIWAGGATEPLAEPASLLNLSANGLACRLPSDAAAFSIDEAVRVSFELDHPNARFEFSASVINLTRGATIDKTILGIEFVSDEMSPADRDRLVAALAATGPR